MTTDTSLKDAIDQQTHRGFLAWLISRQIFWILLAVIIAIIAMMLLTKTFATPQNLFNVTRNFAFVGIVGLGMTAVIITGGIDLSVGATVLISAMTTTIIMHAGLPITLAIPASIAASLLVGLINGVLIAIVGMPAFVVTLGMMSIARSIGMVMSNNALIYEFGPDQAILFSIGGGSVVVGGLPIPNPLIVMVLLALITGFALRWTRWGRHLYAIGGNEKAAVLTGVPVKAVKISVYMFVAFCAGLTGFLQTGWLGSVTTGFGTGLELTVIAATVIGGASLAGGTGTALGAVVGAALIEIIRNSLTLLGISTFWQGTFVGSFIILAVASNLLRNKDTGE
ncbi:sugar ABC transporter permease [Devosia sp. Root413D1]|uniref:Sugar ABC transporter permease n=1 Tax=Devosia insulae DS-56 TaxID=1116389 RepID=A0A1E5XQ18_9HYPH|nr:MULTISPECIES: ABC transporter permease [Devosia]KQU93519.1 sugar ABC transporter permease [Devosia sp. Root105]KQW74991.1 sugar ABC transporter permease [Devosia sp. Root413D1]OEO30671.1 sugar ABC transporter permease [Devosia insulae DS-56]